MPKRVANAKIACIDFGLQKAKMHLGVSVLIEDPTHLEGVRKEYEFCFNRAINLGEIYHFSV